ncbi:MAG: ATP-binding protein [Streptosporangiaceae bacterium]
MSAVELLRIEILDETGIFQARRVGRSVAAEMGFAAQDQVRIGTALSEVGRDLLNGAGSLAVVFSWDPGVLLIEIRCRADGELPSEGLVAAGRLMDTATSAAADDRTLIRLTKRLQGSVWPLTPTGLAEITARLSALTPVSTLEELRRQNEELVQTLEDLQRRGEELVLLNSELAETNQGVMALYSQLSTEMEETNRGVVALYAELDETSAQLREASKAKNRFWTNISHELRSPLNSIIGLVRLLTGTGGDPLTEEQAHQIHLIENSGTTLLSLVNELLDLAKTESSRLDPQPTMVDLGGMLAQLRALLRPLDGGGDVALIVDPVPLSELYTDEVMLTRILRNLLANGLRFTSAGEVRLTVRRAGDQVEFRVRDTGIGIPQDQQERVFEEFYQVPGTIQIGRAGTGLGLPYARRMTVLLGGELELTSVPGTGTTVVVRLPLVTEDPVGGVARLGHILVVDDDADFRQSLRPLLTGLADRITDVADGPAALAVVAADPPDLILLDLRLPSMDGLEVMESLEQLGGNAIVVIVTAADLDRPPRSSGAVVDKSRLTRARLIEAIRHAHGR